MVITVPNIRLSPCPLCGSKATLRGDDGYPERLAIELRKEPHTTPYYWGKCSNTNCSISPHASPTPDDAASRWNTRAA